MAASESPRDVELAVREEAAVVRKRSSRPGEMDGSSRPSADRRAPPLKKRNSSRNSIFDSPPPPRKSLCNPCDVAFRRTATYQCMQKLVDKPATAILSAVLLLVTLFLPDAWTWLDLKESNDVILDAVLLFCFVFFVVEIVLTFMVDHKYRNSFFFWMDLLGTLSVLLDVTLLFPPAPEVRPYGSGEESDSDFNFSAELSKLRAARLARLGARSARLVKLTKLFTLQHKFTHPDERKRDEGLLAETQGISRRLGDKLATRVAAQVMFLVIITPLLNLQNVDSGPDAFVKTFHMMAAREISGDSSIVIPADDWLTMSDQFREFSVGQFSPPPFELDIRGLAESSCPTEALLRNSSSTSLAEADLDRIFDDLSVSYDSNKTQCLWEWDLRGAGRASNELIVERPSLDEDEAKPPGYVRGSFSTRVGNQWIAAASMLLIVITLLLLVGFATSLSLVVHEIVVRPLRNIIKTLRRNVSDLWKVMQMIDNEDEKIPEEDVTETTLLQEMIEKLVRIVANSIDSNKSILSRAIEESGISEKDKVVKWLLEGYSSDPTKKRGTLTEALHFERMETKEGNLRSSGLPKSPATLDEEHLDLLEHLPCVATDIEGLSRLDVLSFSMEESFAVMDYLYDHYDLKSQFGIPTSRLAAFFDAISKNYKSENPYHNWYHGVDVCQTVFSILVSIQGSLLFSQLEILAALTSAVAHDVNHPGFNNAFLSRTRDALAFEHNDRSPLENMHCVTLYKILRDEETNILAELDDDEWFLCRKIMLACILNTDMVKHFDNVKQLQLFYEVNGLSLHQYVSNGDAASTPMVRRAIEAVPDLPEVMREPANRLFLQETILHCADVSNPVKTIAVYEQWVERVTSEFFSQGDEERRRGMPVSAMMDRDTTDIPPMQINFIDFIIAPLYIALFQIFPLQLQPLATNLEQNYRHYISLCQSRMVRESSEALSQKQQEEYEKFSSRMESLSDKLRPFTLGASPFPPVSSRRESS